MRMVACFRSWPESGEAILCNISHASNIRWFNDKHDLDATSLHLERLAVKDASFGYSLHAKTTLKQSWLHLIQIRLLPLHFIVNY